MKKNRITFLVLALLGVYQSLQSSLSRDEALADKPAYTRWFGLGDEPQDYWKTSKRYRPSHKPLSSKYKAAQRGFEHGFGQGNVFGQHVGRFEGATNTLLAQAALYGVYNFYHWARGDVHNMRREVDSALSSLKKCKKRVDRIVQKEKTTAANNNKEPQQENKPEEIIAPKSDKELALMIERSINQLEVIKKYSDNR